jgi:hypothetical protein
MDWRSVLAPELVQQIEDEIKRKYAEGWRDYGRALQARMREMPDAVDVEPERSDNVSSPRSVGIRAPRGYWLRRIEEEVKAVAPDGLLLKDAYHRVREHSSQYDLARSSFNVALMALVHQGRIRRDGSMLFWAGERSGRSDGERQGNGDHADSAPIHQALPFEYMEVAAK